MTFKKLETMFKYYVSSESKKKRFYKAHQPFLENLKTQNRSSDSKILGQVPGVRVCIP